MGEASRVEGFGGCGFLSSSCLINSGCLGLSGLNLTDCASACGALWACSGGAQHPASGGGGGGLRGVGDRGPLVGFGGLCSWGPLGLVRGAEVRGG